MKNHLLLILTGCAAACGNCAPALFGETARENSGADVPAAAAPAETASPRVLILVKDVSGKNLFGNAEAPMKSGVAAQLACVGLETATTDFLLGEKTAGADALSGLSPAETASLANADYALVLQISAPLEYSRAGTRFARQNIAYSLFAGTGEIVDSGRASKIFSAPVFGEAQREMLALDTADELAASLAQKISEKKVVLSKAAAAPTTDAEIVCELEAPAFPQLVRNEDGSYSVGEARGKATFSGVALKIGGIDYHLNPDGTPTRIALPLNRPIFISAEHPDIVPVRRVVKITRQNERVVLAASLSDAARERWKKDLKEISSFIANAERIDKLTDAGIELLREKAKREDKLTDAEAELIRGKAKFWENSGVHFSQSVSREVKVEEKSIFSEKSE